MNYNEASWYVGYTNSRYEKKVFNNLQRLGVKSFLPTIRIKKRWSDRIKEMEVPLFPNYIFIHTKKSKVRFLEEIDGIVKFLSFGGKLAVMKNQQLELIKKALDKTENLALENKLLKEGQEIEIVEGCFMGMRGRLVQKQGKNRFVLELEILNRAILFDMPTTNFKVINEVV